MTVPPINLTSMLVFGKKIALSQTQDKTISEQLECGTNILDLRVSYADGIFYTSHTFCCGPCIDILADIKNYIEKIYRGPDKMVLKSTVLLISPDTVNYQTLLNHEDEFLQLVLAELGSYLTNHKVLIYYKPVAIDLVQYSGIMNMSEISNIWYNAQTTNEFVAQFNKTDFLKCGVNPGLNCVLTPSTNNSDVYNLPNISLKDYAQELRPVALELLAERIKQGKMPPLYCTFDFID